jgi:hypothetical protein
VAPLSEFLETDWFNLVQTISIVLGLIFTATSLRRDAFAKQVGNLLTLKQEHRELWNTIHERPELSRILGKQADLVGSPLTESENVFLRQVIVHVAFSWELIRQGTPLDLEGFRADVTDFFKRPLPRKVWEEVRTAQDAGFRAFLDNVLSSSARTNGGT